MIATEIIPNLWVGDIRSSIDTSFLLRNKINVIINCTYKYNFVPGFNGEKIKIPIKDRGINEDIDHMYDYLIEFVPKIYDMIKNGKRILIHCYAGKHRSIALVAAFIVKYTDLNVDTTLNLLQSKWKRIDIYNFNFIESLYRYYSYLTKF